MRKIIAKPCKILQPPYSCLFPILKMATIFFYYNQNLLHLDIRVYCNKNITYILFCIQRAFSSFRFTKGHVKTNYSVKSSTCLRNLASLRGRAQPVSNSPIWISNSTWDALWVLSRSNFLANILSPKHIYSFSQMN